MTRPLGQRGRRRGGLEIVYDEVVELLLGWIAVRPLRRAGQQETVRGPQKGSHAHLSVELVSVMHGVKSLDAYLLVVERGVDQRKDVVAFGLFCPVDKEFDGDRAGLVDRPCPRQVDSEFRNRGIRVALGKRAR